MHLYWVSQSQQAAQCSIIVKSQDIKDIDMSALKLHWALGSQPGRAVKTLVDMAQIPCELIDVDIMAQTQRTKQYRSMYPPGKIPVLQDGSFTLGQSPAIMNYLCELYPSIRYLQGQTIQQRATINQYVSWYMGYFRPAMFKPIRMYLGAVFTQRPLNLQHKNSLFQEMFSAIGKFDELLAQGGTRFLAGEKLSIADLLFYYEMTNLVYWGLDHEKYTNVKRWFTQVYKVQEVKKITHQWYQIAKGLAEMFAQVEISNSKL